ncbi:hypothetical protein ACIBKX_24875 [Streptomyces sp. NPDC050658]|uniref:nSTAND1 domain-containing NTPase n=1 Tax=unclassified Streptomyces TaxID=2593676 RepID=UPI003441D6E2
MGRREKPIDPAAGPVQALAFELRKLRREAGSPTYRVMADGAGYSVAALARAAAGEALPSLSLTLAYVTSCGGDRAQWEQRWHAVRDEESALAVADESADSPYRGLARFEPGDAELFFGRQELTAEVEGRARRHRVSALVGASGSGKSSLLRAGLVPCLRRPGGDGGGEAPRAVRILTPGVHPLDHRERLKPAPGPGDTWVLVDQFEELFTLCPDARERDAFLELVLAARSEDSRLRVVLAVRADFFGRCAEHSALAAALKDATLLVGPMDRRQCREAVVGPASARGLTVERELTARIVEEVAEEPGGLPLMSHALLETWRRRRGRMLTLQAYESAGGLHGAIARTAEDTYHQLTEAQAALARRILLRMIAPGDGTQHTHHPAPRTEFTAADPGTTADTRAVLDLLARRRLLTLDEHEVSLAHEKLITAWPRLQGWINDECDRIRLHRRLTHAAVTWQALDRDRGGLYRGIRLVQARSMFTGAGYAALNPLEAAFLDASIAADRRREQRTRRTMAALATLLCLALITTALAVQQSIEATQKSRLATSRELAATALGLLEEHPGRAHALARRAYGQAPTTEARSSLLSTYTAARAGQLGGHTRTITSTAFSPSAGTLATAGEDHTVKLWNPEHGWLLGTLMGHSGSVVALAFSPDGRMLASVDADGSARLWDVRTRRAKAVLTGPVSALTSVAFSPDGRTLAAGSEDGTTHLWNVKEPHARAVLNQSGTVWGVAFSPDGRTIATSGDDRRVRLWSAATGKQSASLDPEGEGTDALAFSPDGRTLAASSRGAGITLWRTSDLRARAHLRKAGQNVRSLAFTPDGRSLLALDYHAGIRVWSPEAKRITATLGKGTELVSTMAISPDGKYVAAADLNQVTRVWNADTHRVSRQWPLQGYPLAPAFSPGGRELAIPDSAGAVARWGTAARRVHAELPRHGGPVRSVAYAPNGEIMAVGGPDGIVELWKLTSRGGRRLAVLGRLDKMVLAVAFSPDGRTVATGGPDRTVRLWDVASRKPIAVLRGHEAMVQAVHFSPDGRTLVSAGADHTARLWDVASRRAAGVLKGHRRELRDAGFSPDGKTVATASPDGTARLWDRRTRKVTATLKGHSGPVYGVAFSPDGRTIATVGADRTVRLWDAHSHRTTAVLEGHTDQVSFVAFSPDGHTLATTGADQSVRLWETDPERAIGTEDGH